MQGAIDWFLPINLYCERAGQGFWAEPLNAISSIAFVPAALWTWRAGRSPEKNDPLFTLLVVLGAMIGVGSFLFHTFATMWSSFADVVPIWIFVATYIVFAISKFSGRIAKPRVIYPVCAVVFLLTLAWVALSGLATDTGESREMFNGSRQYLPALTAIYVFAAAQFYRREPSRFWILAAALSFTIALLFRTIDLMVCPVLPMGTHFLWHIGNALMIAFLLLAMKPAATSVNHP